jgi:signal transduction histidine kinase/ActR/RegA family two-component response regulator
MNNKIHIKCSPTFLKKGFYLLLIWIFSAFLPASVSAKTTRQAEKLKQTILSEYIQKPDSAFLHTQKLIRLPNTVYPLPAKINFCKILSEKLSTAKKYQQAYEVLKMADSLETFSSLPGNPDKKPATSIPYGFTLFLIILLSGIIWLMTYYRKAQKKFKALSKEKEKLNLLVKEVNQQEKALEEQVNQQTAGVRKELEQLRQQEAELKTELKKVEEANYLRNAFIANLGFDVRTPLSGIIGFANMLETELALKGNRELYDYAASIEKSGNQLLKLLDNVIDLSALESNRLVLKIKPVKPEPVIKRVFENWKPAAEEKKLIFKSKTDPDLPPVLADETGLEKALSQIVDNAVKYTENGFVTLSAFYAEESDTVCIEIKDNGPGIPESQQKKLFDENPSEISSSGTGIGLRLAQKYIRLMKGNFFLESTPGKGTTVTLHLPCSEKSAVEEMPAHLPEKEITPAAELGNLDVFVVEDDRMNRIILEKMLKPFGEVTLTVDGDDCMQTIAKEAEKGHFFQVMLFDINLPGDWDGIKLLKTIREKYPEYRKIPFIAQTAYAMAGDKERLLKEGFDSYLAKPIDKSELVSAIKQQLQIYGNPGKS